MLTQKTKNIFYTLTITTVIFLTACQKRTNGCFTYSPTTITTMTVVTFNSSCSQNAIYYTWNFGDGTPDTSLTGILAITHKYATTGNYTVTLNAERKDGMTLGKSYPKTSQTITVQ